jgi:hypothetical protein
MILFVMKYSLALLLILSGVLVGRGTAQRRPEPSTAQEFLQVKLGKTLAEQYPECKRYDALNDMKAIRDHESVETYRCYEYNEGLQFGHVFDHDMVVFSGMTADDFEKRDKSALATIETDDDTQQVAHVSSNYSMDIFKETFAAMKARRGQPTSCTTTGVQNLMGAHMSQIHCVWKQPWGLISITAPSEDDLTLFDVWASTTDHIQLLRQEMLANQKKNKKNF